MRKHARGVVALIREFVRLPRRGVEVGVWRGHTSLALLESFPRLRLYCVDPWDRGGDQSTMGDDAARLPAAREEFYRLTEPYADRRFPIEMTSDKSARLLADGFLDFAFIDGCHSYEAVAADVRAWWPKLRRGGLICGHDYGGRGDRSGRFGVKKAVDEWAEELGVIIGTRPGLLWWTRKE